MINLLDSLSEANLKRDLDGVINSSLSEKIRKTTSPRTELSFKAQQSFAQSLEEIDSKLQRER
jgi:hypothetical protein